MTEAQAAVLARHGIHPDRDLTWVHASLLIDDALGTPRGRQATAWLRENGASPENAAKIIELAEKTLRSDSHCSERDAARDAQRRRRQVWAQGARAGPPPAGGARSVSAPRRIAR